MSEFEGQAENICSLGVFRILISQSSSSVYDAMQMLLLRLKRTMPGLLQAT